jgi:NodT family efflux transporter outer membrane factor (OMF) lipoprotein
MVVTDGLDAANAGHRSSIARGEEHHHATRLSHHRVHRRAPITSGPEPLFPLQRRTYRQIGRIAVAGLLIAMMTGCEVGPDFVRPAAPSAKAYTTAKAAPDLNAGSGEPPQRLVVGGAIPTAWWQMFHSRPLDSVVRQALAHSPTIDAAKARLEQSKQLALATRGELSPSLDLSGIAERQKGPPFAVGLLNPRSVPAFDLYSVGPTVTFNPDVFGQTARLTEERTALAENEAYQLAAAQLAVTGNAVTEALTIAAARAQIDALDAIIAEDQKNLALVRQKYTAGRASRTDVLVAQAQLANDGTALPPLKQQAAAAEDALAVLVGKSPGGWMPPDFALDDLTLPSDLPLSVPSLLVRDRPDIRAAEAELHASSAAIGVALGQLYPSITLSASLAPTALTPGALFNGSNFAWNVLAGITAPIFHGGALTAQKEAANAAFRASLATYQQTVLKGLAQVADVLRALGHDAELVHAARDGLDTSAAALVLQRDRYAAGKIDLLHLLDSERSNQQAQVGYARARAQRYLDSAQLFVALGGGTGWHSREDDGQGGSGLITRTKPSERDSFSGGTP